MTTSKQSTNSDATVDRRAFVGGGARLVGAVAFAGLGGFLAGRRGRDDELVWQIDPNKCVACSQCETHCVLDESAVKAVQCFALCGYCDECTGYFRAEEYQLDTAVQNHLCPTGAVIRKFVEPRPGIRYFEYTIDEPKCIGCAKCVEGCGLMNGSLYLQVRHDRCLDCNECAIAVACPADAFVRLPRTEPNLLKDAAKEAMHTLARKKAQRLGQVVDDDTAGEGVDPA